MDTAIYALPMGELRARTLGPDGKRFQIELHKRFAYPAACLVLMLVAVPLGVTSRRGGKSTAWVATLALVVVYYSLSLNWHRLARQDWISAFLAVWMANILFAAGGVFLLWQMASGGRVLNAISTWHTLLKAASAVSGKAIGISLTALLRKFQSRPRRIKARNVFPRILDKYVVREFLIIFCLGARRPLSRSYLSSPFRSAKGHSQPDIGWYTVSEYLINLTPSMLYQITPLAVLIAVLVTFGVLNRNSEIIAMKAAVSAFYRLVISIVSIAAILSSASSFSISTICPRPTQARGSAQHHQGKPRKPSCAPNKTGYSAAASGRARP